MRDLVRSALFIAGAALFAGCGGSQQIGQMASPQLQGDAASTPLPSGVVSHRAPRPLSRYPQSGEPLLYAATDNPGVIDIFPLTGPNQPQIGSISYGLETPWGLSLDVNNALYVANVEGTVTVYPYGSTSPSMTYSHVGVALYALADSTGHVFVSGYGHNHVGHVLSSTPAATRRSRISN